MAVVAKAAVAPSRSGDASLPLSYIEVFRAMPVDRIQMIKKGVRAVEAKRIFADLAISQGGAFAAPATVNRKKTHNKALSLDESERVIGIAKLIGKLQAMVEDSGDPDGFDAIGWMSQWLREPLPAFGGGRPIDLIETMEGQALVSDALSQMQSGAFA